MRRSVRHRLQHLCTATTIILTCPITLCRRSPVRLQRRRYRSTHRPLRRQFSRPPWFTGWCCTRRPWRQRRQPVAERRSAPAEVRSMPACLRAWWSEVLLVSRASYVETRRAVNTTAFWRATAVAASSSAASAESSSTGIIVIIIINTENLYCTTCDRYSNKQQHKIAAAILDCSSTMSHETRGHRNTFVQCFVLVLLFGNFLVSCYFVENGFHLLLVLFLQFTLLLFLVKCNQIDSFWFTFSFVWVHLLYVEVQNRHRYIRQWRGCAVARASDLRFTDHGFESWLGTIV